MSVGPEAGNTTQSNYPRLTELVNRWIVDEDDPWPPREALGGDLASHGDTTHFFRYLQTLIAGEGKPLPFAPPAVKIVTKKEGWKEEYALIYGYPSAGAEHSSAYATQFPDQAATFRIYYGSSHGPGGYERIEDVKDLDEETKDRFKRGEFTDDEAEQLLAEHERISAMYWELMIAARDQTLNPEYGERVLYAFYENAG